MGYKMTNVDCYYTGGGVWIFTALYNDEVWFMTDFIDSCSFGCYDAPLDVVEEDETDDGSINYDGHWKMPSVPLPTWGEILGEVREHCHYAAKDIEELIPAKLSDRVGELSDDDQFNPHSKRMHILSEFIELFEDFLDERGIVLQNDEKEQDDDASNIYGTDYGELESKLETLMIRLGYMEKEEE